MPALVKNFPVYYDLSTAMNDPCALSCSWSASWQHFRYLKHAGLTMICFSYKHFVTAGELPLWLKLTLQQVCQACKDRL